MFEIKMVKSIIISLLQRHVWLGRDLKAIIDVVEEFRPSKNFQNLIEVGHVGLRKAKILTKRGREAQELAWQKKEK